MVKTATITFHASHNYGSMLQAYALQQVLLHELGIENRIINFRSDAQRKMYPLPNEKKYSWKHSFIKFFLINKEQKLTRKYYLFEEFLNENLILTSEYHNNKEVIEIASDFDYLIVGSDQIWNTHCKDFSWLYYLPFAKGNAISYASSMGPDALNHISKNHFQKIHNCLNNFKAISVREQGTADVVKSIIGKDVEVLIDPTLLICREEWDSLSGDRPIIEGDYIFMYHPFINKQIYQITKKISRVTKLPVYISNQLPSICELDKIYKGQRNLRFHLDAGPKEFLNLLKNAKFVISGSFHAAVFSIIFKKPFLAVGGKTDNRVLQLLKSTDLQVYAVDQTDYLQVIDKLFDIDFERADLYIKSEKKKSIAYLKKALNI